MLTAPSEAAQLAALRELAAELPFAQSEQVVVERAAAEGVHVGFREYFRVGLPLTLVTLVVGSIWLFVSL